MTSHSPAPADGPSDGELLARFRAGDASAYGELWSRHLRAALAASRAVAPSLDAEDVASESFVRVMDALRKGKGPDFAFRPYLLAVVRNTAQRRTSGAREVQLGDIDLEDPSFDDEHLLAAVDRSLLARGFRTLPTRWQEVLWYTEVEEMAPAEAAPLLGIKPNAVSALAYRAREGLRRAWIDAHVASAPEGSECRWTVDHLAARERGTLKPSEMERLAAHLEECSFCPIAVEGAKEASVRLGPAALSALLGVGAAATYLGWHTVVAPSAASAATPPPLPASAQPTPLGVASAAKTAGAASRWSRVGATAAGGALILAIAAAIVVPRPSYEPVSDPHSSTAPGDGLAVPPASASVPSASARAAWPTADPSRSTATVPTVSAVQSSAPAPSAHRAPNRSAQPVARATDPASPQPSKTSQSAPTDSATPAPTPSPSDSATPTPSPVASEAPLPPELLSADTGGGRYFPIVSGRGDPGALVEVSGGGRSATTTVDAAGEWTIPALSGIAAGVTTISATQLMDGLTSAASTGAIDLVVPTVTSHTSTADGIVVTIAGLVGATVALEADGSGSEVTLDGSGGASATLPAAASSVVLRYAGDGRTGPEVAVSLG